MNWKYWTILGIVFTALLVIVVYQYNVILYKDSQLKDTEQKVLPNNVVKSEVETVTKKQLEEEMSRLRYDLDSIRKDLKSSGGGTPTGVNLTITQTGGTDQKGVKSDREEDTKPTPAATSSTDTTLPRDVNGYYSKKQFKRLDEDFSGQSIPIGEVGFDANNPPKANPGPWSVKIFPRKYSSSTVIAVDRDGRNKLYNKFFIEVDGKVYEIKIDTAHYSETYPKPQLYFPNLRLYMALGAGAQVKPLQFALSPNLSLSLFSFGRTKSDSTWMFAGLGLGYEAMDQEPVFVLTPVGYNVGRHLPFVENIFVAPQVSVDFAGNVGIYGSLAVGL